MILQSYKVRGFFDRAAAPRYEQGMHRVLLASILGLSACQQNVPGESLGVYKVRGSLQENTCGITSFYVPDPLEMVVDVRTDSDRAFYVPDGQPMLIGTPEGDDQFRFRTQGTAQLTEADLANGLEACTVARVETIDVTIAKGTVGDAGVATDDETPISLLGSQVLDIAPMPESYCLPLLSTYGGTFESLPCRVRYELTGTPEDG
jgi:hypothetical protein